MSLPGSGGEIFVVDDDPAVRDTLSIVLSGAGYKVVCFADGVALLVATRTRSPMCIILDVHIPGRSGLEVLKELNAHDYPAPIFIMSGQGDIAMAVDAIKNGALDFIEKPFRGGDLVTRIRDALGANASRIAALNTLGSITLNFPGREPLTRREREVLSCLVDGATNKDAGRTLGISPRTVEVHRARLMEKLDAKSATDLIRIAITEGMRH
jgi:FixJ family two-component response regulator